MPDVSSGSLSRLRRIGCETWEGGSLGNSTYYIDRSEHRLQGRKGTQHKALVRTESLWIIAFIVTEPISEASRSIAAASARPWADHIVLIREAGVIREAGE
jgi:hypothetical protein